ncbi:MAG: single-stranded DNA-binding protein [Acholeplasmataceae bacterium]|nr:single-stranded DNA-binding protein [Acholeplasmataceae bacterium]
MKNLGAKLILIMKDCSYIQKSGFNEYHRYKFASAADVFERINAALVKHNVCSIVNAELVDMVNTTNQAKNERFATVKTTVTLIDIDSGESLTCVGLGSGADVGDKAVMKAQTASLKYAYMMTLAIATGDDPEADVETDRRNAPQAAATPVSKPNIQDEGEPVCSDCGAPLTKGVLKVSVSRYHKPLCMKCQKLHAA